MDCSILQDGALMYQQTGKEAEEPMHIHITYTSAILHVKECTEYFLADQMKHRSPELKF